MYQLNKKKWHSLFTYQTLFNIEMHLFSFSWSTATCFLPFWPFSPLNYFDELTSKIKIVVLSIADFYKNHLDFSLSLLPHFRSITIGTKKQDSSTEAYSSIRCYSRCQIQLLPTTLISEKQFSVFLRVQSHRLQFLIVLILVEDLTLNWQWQNL